MGRKNEQMTRAPAGEGRCAGHGLQREPHLWRAGGKLLQRALRMHLLSSAVRVQPNRRLRSCALRPGNVHSADGWHDVLEPVVARYRTTMERRYFHVDAAFASPKVYKLFEAEAYGYVIRLPANAVLQRRIAHLLTRPVDRPPHEVRRFYAAFATKPRPGAGPAGLWPRWHPGELYSRIGFW